MPRNSNRKKRKAQTLAPAVRDLYLQWDPAADADSRRYVDTMKELSKVNRRLYEQGKLVAFQGLTFIWKGNTVKVDTIEVTVRTAPNTWMTHNAYVKGKALWHEMQDLVLKDNPSIKGRWHDFKVQLWEGQSLARTMEVLDGSGAPVTGGEWAISTYVMPQHEVNPTTGEPLAAEEFTGMLIGQNTATKRSLVLAYQDSRATVQSTDPNVPAAMSTSFFNLLTDSGSQEPELADQIEDENDQPPYDVDDYVGGDVAGMRNPFPVQYGAISASEVDGRLGGFVAPCGLVEIDVKGFLNGVPVLGSDMPIVDILLHVAPGMYKGVAALPMGQ